MINALLVLVSLSSFAHAGTLAGKLDLAPNVAPVVERELHDGQWLAGLAKSDLWHLDCVSDCGFWSGRRLHTGPAVTWNAQHGNLSFGQIVGVDIPAKVGEAAQAIGDALHMSESFKPASLLGSMLSLDVTGGWRPIHDASVKGDLSYGIAATLKISFGVKELAAGL